MNLDNAAVFDVEVYPNCFVLVAKTLKDNEVHKFVFSEAEDNYTLLKEFLRQKPTLIGYNSIAFDAQILELIWRSETKVSPKQIFDFVDEFIAKRKEDRFFLPYSEWDLSFAHLDLLKMNHMDSPNKMTSLKWLEFTLLFPKMTDMPIPVGSNVPPSSVSKLVSYCVNDVLVTETFFNKCLPMVSLRKELAEKFSNPRIYNMADSSIGEYVFKQSLKQAGVTDKELKAVIPRHSIDVGSCLLPYISFRGEEFNSVLDTFKSMTISNVSEDGLKGIHSQTVDFKGMPFDFGTGGLHSSTKPGVYSADDNYTILTIDCRSYYPFLSIVNGFHPEHLNKDKFCRVYKDLYDSRAKYPKGSSMNYALKIALNGAYGKSNNKYSFLYDPKFTISITINGQLLLAMLAEALSEYGQLLTVNTDGLEIRVLKTLEAEVRSVCSEWELLTGLELEYGEYSKFCIKDVNNYIAVSTTGSIKRKGMFRVYSDYTGDGGSEHNFDENPSGIIIPEALCEYYVNNIPPEETISGCNSIYPFLFALKTRRNFEYWLISADEDGVTDIEQRGERAIRYFIKKRGANLYKFWLDDRKSKLQSVKKGHLVETAMSISKNGEIISIRKGKKGEPSTTVVNFEPDREFYVSACYKIIQAIESGNELIPDESGYTTTDGE